MIPALQSPIQDHWYAIYTKYKCEKQVHRDLLQKGVNAYIPLIEKVKRYTRKIKRYQIPLLNCYVFVNINARETSTVLATENVLKFIKPSKKLVPIPEEEINILRKVCGDKDYELEVSPSDYSIGEIVEITRGNLTGLRGRLERKENKNTVTIDLISIGYQLKITVGIDAIAKIA
jgi:transcription antitermination factor NusG